MSDLSIQLQINPEDVPFITKVFEGYDGLAIVSTIDGRKGIIKIMYTPGTKPEVMEILANFPKNIQVI